MGCVSKEQQYVNTLEHFVNNTEKSYKHLSSKQWEHSENQFKIISHQYRGIKGQLTQDEREKVSSLMGRYRFIQIKVKAKNFIKDIKDGFDQTKSIIREVINDTSLVEN